MKHYSVNTDHKWLNIPDDTLGTYNAWDCLATARIWAAQTNEQRENSQHAHYRKVWWPLVGPVMDMARRGLLVDMNALAQVTQRAKDEISQASQVINTAAGEEVNLNSPKQKAKLLYETLGLKCGKQTTKGGQSTDQYALDWILRNLRKRDSQAVPIVHALFHSSRWRTIASRYLNPYIHPNGRVYPTIKMGSAETLRLAYAEPPLQQFPKEIRGIYKASPGHLFVSIDYSQLEARILAVLSGDIPSLETFQAGADIHNQNAKDLFGAVLSEAEISEDQKARDYAKTFLYGISYGGKSETLKAKLFCPCPLCKDQNPDTLAVSKADRVAAEQRWFRKHPAVKVFRTRLASQVRRDGYWTTPFGYKRFFFSPAYSILPEIYNFPMQSTAAGLVNQRFIRLSKAKVPLALQMHDEIMAEVPEAQAQTTASAMQEIMEASVPELAGTVFPTKAAIGPSWGSLEEVEL